MEEESLMISKMQLRISVAAIMITIIASVIGVTLYITSIEREQALLKGRMDAFDSYGSKIAREAENEVAKLEARQQSDIAVVEQKLKNIEYMLSVNNTMLSELKIALNEHKKETQKP